jgi:4-hydroxyphenylacetate 3-monooxygenase
MGARSGNNYLSSLRKLKAEVWLGETRIADPTIHPAFVYRARAIASLYDSQMEHPGALTYRLDDGDRAGISFIQPQSAAEVQARGSMFRRWAEFSGGLLRDSPDAHNAVLAAMAAAAAFFEANDSRFGANVQDYYYRARHHDWCTAQTILDPEAAQSDPRVELINTVGEGLVVNGTQRLSALAPLAEELLILPPRNLLEERFALAFAINCNARGLTLHCSEVGEVPHDGPPPGLFNESGCVGVFDHVVIPWDRVFLCRDVARCNAMLDETGASLNLRYQQALRGIVATEFRLGSAATLATKCKALEFPRVRERLAEMILVTHLARSLVQAAETAAKSDRWNEWLPLAEPLGSAISLLAQVYNQSL